MISADRPWMCHRYEETQTNEWCKNAGLHGGMEYRCFGEDSPCGDCWCCKRHPQEEERAEELQVATEAPASRSDSLWEAAAGSEKDSSWMCHRYEAGQGSEWCKTKGVERGIEYKFF